MFSAAYEYLRAKLEFISCGPQYVINTYSKYTSHKHKENKNKYIKPGRPKLKVTVQKLEISYEKSLLSFPLIEYPPLYEEMIKG